MELDALLYEKLERRLRRDNDWISGMEALRKAGGAQRHGFHVEHLVCAYRALLNVSLDEASASRIFARMDKDGDGRISQSDFQAWAHNSALHGRGLPGRSPAPLQAPTTSRGSSWAGETPAAKAAPRVRASEHKQSIPGYVGHVPARSLIVGHTFSQSVALAKTTPRQDLLMDREAHPEKDTAAQMIDAQRAFQEARSSLKRHFNAAESLSAAFSQLGLERGVINRSEFVDAVLKTGAVLSDSDKRLLATKVFDAFDGDRDGIVGLGDLIQEIQSSHR